MAEHATDLVRVKNPDGVEYTTSRAHAKRHGLKILTGKEDRALDRYGRPARPKTPTSPGQQTESSDPAPAATGGSPDAQNTPATRGGNRNGGSQ